ncbi:MAG: hypothetical protein CMP61_08700 [Flavobacteriales bacterium]|nr:hypothetical protein [Flavobacteriales bacterium]|tara:strand:- start:554 stop:1102 length:549 start_codon:yes stop_codon:yes gene_type:complete
MKALTKHYFALLFVINSITCWSINDSIVRINELESCFFSSCENDFIDGFRTSDSIVLCSIDKNEIGNYSITFMENDIVNLSNSTLSYNYVLNSLVMFNENHSYSGLCLFSRNNGLSGIDPKTYEFIIFEKDKVVTVDLTVPIHCDWNWDEYFNISDYNLSDALTDIIENYIKMFKHYYVESC